MTARTLPRVFVGPTLDAREAAELLDADYRPPLAADDLALAKAAGVEVAVIIDCTFMTATTASVTQIALCLAAGMRIFGAAGAGALRAVECGPLGMIGVGSVYDLFSSGFEDEAEIAVAIDPATNRACSVAMINVRHACRRAQADGVIAESAAEAIAAAASTVHFTRRTHQSVIRASRGLVCDDELDRYEEYRTERAADLDLMAADARLCLDTVRGVLQPPTRPVPVRGTAPLPENPRAAAPSRQAESIREVLDDLARTGDGQLAVDLVEVARLRPEDHALRAQLDQALCEVALRIDLSPGARHAWAELRAMTGDLRTAAELRWVAMP